MNYYESEHTCATLHILLPVSTPTSLPSKKNHHSYYKQVVIYYGFQCYRILVCVSTLCWLCGKKLTFGAPAAVQWVKDSALPQLCCGSQLWLRFDPSPRNFHMIQVWSKKDTKRRKKNESRSYHTK